jgi:hypothetical protein
VSVNNPPMRTNRLTDAAYRATMLSPMRDVKESATDVIDIWPYVSAIPEADLKGHTVWDQFVEYVYRTADDIYDHVLVMTRSPNVYLVILIDLKDDQIYGHYLLDLIEEYGLSATHS